MNKVKVARNSFLAAGVIEIIGGAIAYSRMKQSTKDYIRSVGWHRLDLWPHGLFYLSRTPLYEHMGRIGLDMAGPMIPSFVKKYAGDTYHAKPVPLEEAKQLVSVKEDIEALNLEQVIPYRTARDIILKHGDSIAVAKCSCRLCSKNPCDPLEVCLIVGEPVASFVLDHQPGFARRITADEAMDILDTADKNGFIHAAFFRDLIGGKFFIICNCCKCCCIAVHGQNYHGIDFFAHSGLMPTYDAENCTSCGKCVKACPFNALTVAKNETPVFNTEKCLGCGVCRGVCPSDAVTLVRAPGTPEPLLVDSLYTDAPLPNPR